jgi:hypothetical protein
MRRYHPKLDTTVDVNPRQAAVLEQSGWVDPAEPQPAAVGDRPADSVTKDVWVDYAESLGLDTAGLTKQQIIDAVDDLSTEGDITVRLPAYAITKQEQDPPAVP